MEVPEFVRGRESRNRLVVLLHAYSHDRQKLEHVFEVIKSDRADSDIYTPELPFGLWSMADPVEVTARLLANIEERWQARKVESDGIPYSSITFVGHSLGALVARKAYVYACGAMDNAPFEAALDRAFPRDWRKPLEWAMAFPRFRGHYLKGGYDVPNAKTNQGPTGAAGVLSGVQDRGGSPGLG